MSDNLTSPVDGTNGLTPQNPQASRELAELVDRLAERMRAGHAVDLESLAREHPDHADQLARLLPAAEALVWLGISAASGEVAVAIPADSGVQPSGLLGDFRLMREIGRGGMGIVYEAEQLSLGRRVALKVLPFAATIDEKSQRRFKNEALAAAHLDHPHIVDVYGVGCERGVHYYAMRLIEGRTLADLIEDLRCNSTSKTPNASHDRFAAETVPQIVADAKTAQGAGAAGRFLSAAELGLAVAEALDHAHRQGIVHRDIKPSNLLLDGRRKVWITDFGLAHIDAGPSLTMTGDVMGTLRYMSPEQALARVALIDHRTDIYSLGATLYELLTLKPVFAGSDRQAVLRQIADDDPLPPRSINDQVPVDLQTIVLKALSKDPSSRFATAGDMAADLRRFLCHQPILARPPSLADRLRKWSRRHQAAVTTAIVAAVTLLAITIAFLGVSTVLVSQAQRKTQQALDEARKHLAASKRQSDRADENFQTVSAAVDRLLTRVAEGPLMRPELQSVRGDILQDALEFFEQLRAQKTGDPALRYETAWAQTRVGVIRDVLGQKDQARENLRTALNLLEELLAEAPASSIYRTSIVRVAVPLGKIESDPVTAALRFRRAIALSGELISIEPGKHANRAYQAAAWQELGYHQRNQGDFQEAEKSYRAAQAIYQQLAADMGRTYPYASAQAYAANSHGLLLRTMGKYAEAERAHRQALMLLAPSVGPEASQTTNNIELARAHFHLGLSLWRLRRPAEAEMAIRQAVVIRDLYNVDRPADRFNRVELALVRQTHSLVLEGLDLPVDAEAIRRQARAELTDLLAEFPESTVHAMRLAGVQASLGRLLWETNRWHDARAEFQESIRLYEHVLAQSPTDADAQNDFAWLLAHCPDIALRDPERAVRLSEQSIAQVPAVSVYWTTLGAAHYRHGNWPAAAEMLACAADLEPRSNAVAALFLAMTYARQNDVELARRSFANAHASLDKHPTLDPYVASFQREAESLIAAIFVP